MRTRTPRPAAPRQRPPVARENTSPRGDARGATLEQEHHEEPWRTVVWNDPVNLMNYVVHVLRTYFGYDRPRAEQLMLQVHREGRAIVSRGSLEQMETDVRALHGYGLHATIERGDEP